MKKSVCALVVTYNRKEYLCKLIIEGLMKQSYPIERILIFDNNSTDGTAQMLQECGIVSGYTIGELSTNTYLGKTILYFQNASNDGGSGGFHLGIKLAVSLGCDLIWTMDDDVLPDAKCLENLVCNMNSNSRVCVPCRTDENYADYAVVDFNMTNPFLYSIKARRKRVLSNNIDGMSISVKVMPFEGPLFDASLIDEVGLPLKDLFIFFDDAEYAFRISQVTDIRYIKNAVLHRQIIPNNNPRRLMNWRDYYSLRNQYWFDKVYGKNIFVRNLRPIFSFLDRCMRSVIKRKWNNLKIIKKAYHDGTHGLLGKTVNPGETFKT